MKASKRNHRRRLHLSAPIKAGHHAPLINRVIGATAGATVPRPRVARDLSKLPALERAAEVLRFSAARLEHWLSPGGGLRSALRRGLLFWCLLAIAVLLVAPMVTLLLGQLVAWTGLLAFAVHQLMLLPLGVGVFLLGCKGALLLWRRLFGR